MNKFPEFGYISLNDKLIINEISADNTNVLGGGVHELKGKEVVTLFLPEIRTHIALQLNVLFEVNRETVTTLIDPFNPDPLLDTIPYSSQDGVRRIKWTVKHDPSKNILRCVIQDFTVEFQRIYSAFSTLKYNEQVVEQVTDGIIMYDNDCRILSANEAVLRSLGLTWLQLKNRALIHPAWHIVKENKERHAGFDAIVSRVLRERIDRPAEIVGIYHPNAGSYRWFYLSVIIHRGIGGIRHGAGLVLKDITEQFALYERVRLDKQEVTYLAQKMYEGIWISNRQMNKTIFVNDSFRKAMGFSLHTKRNSIRKRLIETVLPEYRNKLITWINTISAENPHAELTAPFQSEEGYTRWFKASLFEHQSLIPEKNVQRIVLLRDVTEEMELVEKLDQARIAAETLSELKSNIIANINHEFRTPLTGILGFSSLASEVLPEEIVQNYIQPIAANAERLSQTLSLITDFSLLEAGSMGMFPRALNLHDILDRAIDEYRKWCYQKRLTFFVKMEGQNNVTIDSFGVLRITDELIRNAVKFTAEGGVSLFVHADENNVVIRVNDTGEGIDPADTDKVYEPFRQLSEGLSRKFEGIGLGMAVVKKQVELMQGGISIHENKPSGISVTVVLPHLKQKN